jgi:hypothetical protein
MAIADRELRPLLAPKVKVGVRGKALEDWAQGLLWQLGAVRQVRSRW